MTDQNRPRIMLIEDYDPARESLAKTFDVSGWECVAIATGSEAINYIKAGSNLPGVVLVDLMLPDISGVEVIRQIRTSGVRSRATKLPVRVVIYTCCDHKDPRIIEAMALGADGVILKPCAFEDMLPVIEGHKRSNVAID